MTVGELIEYLQQYDTELEVAMSSDPEGNGYSLFHSAEIGALYDGERYMLPEQLNDVARSRGYTEEDVCTRGVRVLFMYPEY